MPGGSIAPSPSRPARTLKLVVLGVAVTLVAGGIGWVAAGGVFEAVGQPAASGHGTAAAGGQSGAHAGSTNSIDPIDPDGGAQPTATPAPPTGGTELYGYLPYWQMTDSMATYLAGVPVSTLALFSVSATLNGGIKHSDPGYQRITGPRGAGLIADAHARGQRVDLVFTSFGYRANARLFGDDPKALQRRARVARELTALASTLGVDGVNVDVELIDGNLADGYATFIETLGAGLRSANPHATVSAATTASHNGADLARAAIAGGADRVFLMGYDYHWSGSAAGASSPLSNRDGTLDLPWSIAAYVDAGVPRDRILLGLPLYGMSWPVSGPGRAAAVLGTGRTWVPSQHTDQLLAPGFMAGFDQQEIADYFAVPQGAAWLATYYDSPRSLLPKLGLARSQGLAGAGFWALGYEKGLPGYLELMADFVAGRIAG
jgi:spore germination protein